jgi:hypothetical protein
MQPHISPYFWDQKRKKKSKKVRGKIAVILKNA